MITRIVQKKEQAGNVTIRALCQDSSCKGGWLAKNAAMLNGGNGPNQSRKDRKSTQLCGMQQVSTVLWRSGRIVKSMNLGRKKIGFFVGQKKRRTQTSNGVVCGHELIPLYEMRNKQDEDVREL